MTTALLDAGGYMRWPQWLRRWRCRRTRARVPAGCRNVAKDRANALLVSVDGTDRRGPDVGMVVLPVPSSLTRVACLAIIATGIA